MRNISIIGAGNMGAALAVGLADAGYNVKISNRTQSKLDRISVVEGISTFTDNLSVIDDADILILAVQPAELVNVINEIGASVNYNRTIVLSLTPADSLSDLEDYLQPYNKAPMIARVMPNTAVSVGESMTFICLNEYAAAYSSEIRSLFETVGKVEIVDEQKFSAAMMLCSCGLAYAFRYIRASSEGGVAMGFEAQDACRYVCQTLRGAAAIIERYKLHPEAAVDSVTTPGGVTIQGLIAMEKAGFTPAVLAGLVLPSKKNQRDE